MFFMDATPKELRDCDIREAFRGYNREDVDELLDRAAATIEKLQESARQLGERVTTAESDAGRGRETEDMLHRTLLLAQRTADEAVAEARARSTQMVEEAETRSRALLSEAESSARRVADAEQKRLHTEVQDLSARRDALAADLDALESYAADYRARLRAVIEADLSHLTATPSPVSPPRPMTFASETPIAAPTPPPPPPPPSTYIAEPAPTYEAPAAASAPLAPPDIDLAGEATRTYASVAESAPGDTSGDTPGGETTPAADADTTAPTERPKGLFQTGSAAALDDDAFFATLRDAVRDERPLGAEGDGLFDENNRRDDAGYGLFRRRR
jgi:DivIVA domain-containing protein